MIGIIFSVVCLIMGFATVIGSEAPIWVPIAYIGIAALWYIGYQISALFDYLTKKEKIHMDILENALKSMLDYFEKIEKEQEDGSKGKA